MSKRRRTRGEITGMRRLPVRVVAVEEVGGKLAAAAWRYRYAKHDEVYMQIKTALGDVTTFRLLVPR